MIFYRSNQTKRENNAHQYILSIYFLAIFVIFSSLKFLTFWKTLNFCFKKLESNQQPAYLSRKNTSELELKYYKKAFLDKFLLWFKALDGYPKIWNCQKIVQFFNLLIVTPTPPTLLLYEIFLRCWVKNAIFVPKGCKAHKEKEKTEFSYFCSTIF